MLRALLEAMRPHQWVKNLLVFAPLVFAHKLGDPAAMALSAGAFAAFCMISSAVYLLNDIVDREADRAHPIKQNRAVASGRLPVGAATAAFLGLLAGALLLAASLDGWRGGGRLPFAVWPAAYFGLNLGYSFWLKHVVIVDCIAIAFGFGLRVHAGGAVLAVPTSSWILLCTFFFALFLAFCKRREEVARYAEASGYARATTREYALPFLDQMIAPLAALSILSYALYTVAEETMRRHQTDALKFTVPFVVFGVFRYLYLVHRRGEGADPARLLFRDTQLVLSGVTWGLAVWLALRYGGAPGA
jgi:4-hydroxybenzoate polyprenyltransferase